MSLRRMTNKVLQALTVAGISLCLWCAVYMIYVAASEQAAAKIESSGTKTMLAAAGFVAIAEGVIVHTDTEHTVIQYYHKWDRL